MLDPIQAAARLLVFAAPTRLRLVAELLRGPCHVGELARRLGLSLLNASQHLQTLRHAGLVTSDRDPEMGQRVVYRLAPDGLVPGCDEPGDLGTFDCGGWKLTVRETPRAKPPRRWG